MEKKNKYGKLGLAAKAAAIFGAAFAALTGTSSDQIQVNSVDEANANTISINSVKKAKPMPVLKLNFANGENKFIASHSSHRSHRSHASHRSHYSSSYKYS